MTSEQETIWNGRSPYCRVVESLIADLDYTKYDFRTWSFHDDRRAVDRLVMAQQVYYDIHNNGIHNRSAAELWKIF